VAFAAFAATREPAAVATDTGAAVRRDPWDLMGPVVW
jgi:hypothetical protein